jgi:WD40 repeat protein
MPGRAEDQPCLATATRVGGEGMRILTVCLLLSLPPLFGACQGVPPRPPEVIVENGNSGGSVLATSPDSRWVASGGWSGWVRVWALENGAAHAAWRAHNDSVNGVLFSQDGTRVLTAGYDGRMALWTIGGRLIDQWPTGSPVTGFAAASGADRVVTGHDDGSVRLWRTDGTPLETWSQVHGGRVRAVALDADGSSISAAGTDGQVTFWKTGDTPRRLEAPPSDARALLFDPQGTRLIGAGWFELFQWELPGGKLRRIETEHRGIINDLEFLPDGRVASISRQTDSSVLLLDPLSGKTLERLQRHDLCGVAVAPSPDGRFLATTSDDATVRIWRLEPLPSGGLTRR